MTTETVTEKNITFYPQQVIKGWLKQNFPHNPIYSTFPDLTAMRSPSDTEPFIVIPDSSLEQDRLQGKYAAYSGVIEGSIWHSRERLGDDKVRNIKQKLFYMFEKDEFTARELAHKGVRNVVIRFINTDGIPFERDSKALQEFPFEIEFGLGVH